MTEQIKILAFAGSLRKDSLNKKLVKIAAEGAKKAGAEVTLIDLKDYPLPIFDQDLAESAGFPENALKLKKLFSEHHGFLIASPEYNSSMTAVLKNVVDWVSRPVDPKEAFLRDFQGKGIVLMSASPGQLGGLRGLVHVRAMFSNLFCHVLPQQKSVPLATDVFDSNGNLKDKKTHEEILSLGKHLTQFLRHMQSQL